MNTPTREDLKAYGYDTRASRVSCMACGKEYLNADCYGPPCNRCRTCATAAWERGMAEATKPKPVDYTGLWPIDSGIYDWVFDTTDAPRGVWGTRRAEVIVAKVGTTEVRVFTFERAVTVKESEDNDPHDRLGAACRDTWAEASLQAMAFITEQNAGRKA